MFPRRSLSRTPTVAALVAGALVLSGAPALPSEDDTYLLSGLTDEVRIAIDSAGVSHIYAENTDDLFFAQGLNAARDRLFQMDLQRRQGLGELSAVFGPGFVEHDRAARLFMYRGDMDEEWESYGPEARSAAERFTEGVNAYIDLAAEDPRYLPPEFSELGYSPARWSPEDIVRIRSNSLGSNFTTEVIRTLLACMGDPGASELLTGMEPDHELTIPEGLDPCSVPPDVLTPFILAATPVTLAPGDGSTAETSLEDAYRASTSEGSNSWVISPERTETGRPIMADDPHRRLSAPSLRYAVHLSGPDFDVIGAGEPFLPGVAIGHNGTAAFGLTFLQADQQDLYVYELDPDDPSRYRYDGDWEEMTTVVEEVAVADGTTEEVRLDFTRHGPVLGTDEENDAAFALRTTWSEPGTAAYFNSVGLLGVEDFDGFREALSSWGGPPMNYTYADTDGRIGWASAGLMPIREGYDGLLPVPGDGTYEWDGFQDRENLPYVLDPEDGFFATANEYNLPEDLGVGYEWDSGYRHDRIVEVLEERDRSSVADSMALQGDHVDRSARDVLPLVEALDAHGDAARAQEILRDWDHVASVDSAGAALYRTWVARHLGPRFYSASSPVLGAVVTETMHTRALLDAVAEPERWLGEEAEEKRDEILQESLESAFEELSETLDPDPGRWRWGGLQKTYFPHPTREPLGPFERGGTPDTVDASGADTTDFTHVSGASFRVVVDVGAWDSSFLVNAPGQSGDPNDPHYSDHVDAWRNGEYLPLLYSESAVAADTEREIVLTPTD
ncbi:penicillin acylase family protein [Nocardiopsis alba]|uniref:penicillin acylase family protein n=1 Tax=Nocardiopsis alba TaxID=53437 RepID=UPI0033AF5AFE